MSVQGTILVLDGVSTNRIMLKVQLTAAWYQVAQGDKLAGLPALLRRVQPDLVLAALTLPDGTASDVKKLVRCDPQLRDVPVVAIAQQNDKTARLSALSDGLDDVLPYPFKDTYLLARVRSLLRARAETQDLRGRNDVQSIGFSEAPDPFLARTRTDRIAVLTRSASRGAIWRRALAEHSGQTISTHTIPNLRGLLSGSIPDAIVVDLDRDAHGLNLLTDLKSRNGTRKTAVIGVIADDNAALAADALDRGADAICMGGFCAHEISLRIGALVARKTQDDHMRAALRRGLEDSLIDPLTGLNNRRFALSALARTMARSRETGQSYAIMLADLDHFKSINDRFGHVAGDQILIEAAKRMKRDLGAGAFLARIGGEEFLIGMPDIIEAEAKRKADEICTRISSTPFVLPDVPTRLTVTVSVGLKLCDPHTNPNAEGPGAALGLIKCADQALYAAKRCGRNQVRLSAA